MESNTSFSERLAVSGWHARRAAHERAAREWTEPYAARRAANQPHPVHDFLFTYYRYSMRKLEAWHPGWNVRLEDDGAPSLWEHDRYYRRDAGWWGLDPSRLESKAVGKLRWISELLRALAARPPQFACHGLHEWAMVYQGENIRHEKSTPLRLPQAEIDTLVSSRPLACTHFDAFRFFARQARPLNHFQPGAENRSSMEQPGCVHANMDLYKWAYQSMPWSGSAILMDTFRLALDLRELDMRASPYDLGTYGYTPIRIETRDGRSEYESRQRALAARASNLRERLRAVLQEVIAAVPGD